MGLITRRKVIMGGVGTAAILLGGLWVLFRSIGRGTPPVITYTTPLRTIPVEPRNIRKAIVANCYAIEGVDAGDPQTRAIMLELLGPVKGKWDIDRPFRVRKNDNPPPEYLTQGVSTCGLVAEGLLRRVGCTMPDLYRPYVVGSSIARTINYAIQVGAWRTPKGNNRPMPGDFIVVGSRLGTHALTAMRWESNYLISIDGGQVCPGGLQCIKRRRRLWSGGKLGSRAVKGWASASAMKYAGKMTVPEGWKGVNV